GDPNGSFPEKLPQLFDFPFGQRRDCPEPGELQPSSVSNESPAASTFERYPVFPASSEQVPGLEGPRRNNTAPRQLEVEAQKGAEVLVRDFQLPPVTVRDE